MPTVGVSSISSPTTGRTAILFISSWCVWAKATNAAGRHASDRPPTSWGLLEERRVCVARPHRGADSPGEYDDRAGIGDPVAPSRGKPTAPWVGAAAIGGALVAVP